MIIYQILNKINGKFYIGLTNGKISRPKGRHKFLSKTKQSYFYNSIRKYGWENFDIKIIDSDATSYDHLKELEIWYIEHLKPHYNITEGGDGVVGLKHTKETIKKMTQHNIGKKLSQEHIEIMRQANLGNKYNLGRKQPEEQKNKTSKFFTNRKQSEEHKEKKNKANRGQKRTPEQIENISKAHIGQKAWNKGVPITEDRKRKMLESRRKFFENKRKNQCIINKDKGDENGNQITRPAK